MECLLIGDVMSEIKATTEERFLDDETRALIINFLRCSDELKERSGKEDK